MEAGQPFVNNPEKLSFRKFSTSMCNILVIQTTIRRVIPKIYVTSRFFSRYFSVASGTRAEEKKANKILGYGFILEVSEHYVNPFSQMRIGSIIVKFTTVMEIKDLKLKFAIFQELDI